MKTALSVKLDPSHRHKNCAQKAPTVLREWLNNARQDLLPKLQALLMCLIASHVSLVNIVTVRKLGLVTKEQSVNGLKSDQAARPVNLEQFAAFKLSMRKKSALLSKLIAPLELLEATMSAKNAQRDPIAQS